MAVDWQVLRDPAQLSEFEAAWTRLLERSEGNEPMLSPLWLGAWWRVFGAQGGRSLRVLLVRDGAQLIGLAPLLARRHWYRRGLPFRRLELLGSGEPERDEICSEYLGILAERGREADVARVLIEGLETDRLGAWDELLLPAMRAESDLTRLLIDALHRAGFSTHASVTAHCPYISLPRSWEEYLAALSSPHRRFVKQTLGYFHDWAQGQWQLHEARTPAQLELGCGVLRTLHGERWSATGRSGVFASAPFCAFHDQVMRALLASGALELSWLSVRDQPVAALYNLNWNDKVYFYQSGRKLDVPSSVRPGIVAHAMAIRRAIEAGRREYDFLGGASQYKRKLATSTHPLLSVRAVRSPVRELVRASLERGIDVVRSVRVL